MNGEPTQRQLFDAILNLQGAMLHGFNTLDGRMTKLETRMTSLEGHVGGLERRMTTIETRFHEFDEDFQSFRVEVNRRFDRIDRQFV